MEVITLLQGNEDSVLTPFFMVHAISGVALPFLRLDALCDDDRPVYGITNHMHCLGHQHVEYPSSLAELARVYLEEIRAVQPHGPYLLGGWSMGGMVAMFMAQELQARREEVLKVIMIDSANPEAFPRFASVEQGRAFARATYARISQGGEDEFDDEMEMHQDDMPLPVSRQTTWSSVATGSSRASSVFDYDSSDPSPGTLTPLSQRCSSSETSACCSDSDSDSGSDCSDTSEINPWDTYGPDESDSSAQDLLLNINLHVHQGIGLIGSVSKGDLFAPGVSSDFDVLLVKCRPEPLNATHARRDAESAEYMRTVMSEASMRWDAARFRSFESVPFGGYHDGAFEPECVGELSGILRRGLERVR